MRIAACDLFADRDLAACGSATRVSSYPAGLESWLRQQPQVPWMYTGALENHPALIDEMATSHPLWGNSGEAVAAARDPARWCAALTRWGLPVIPWSASKAPPARDDESWLSAWSSALAMLPVSPAAAELSWLFKPRASGGGIGIRRAADLAAQLPAKPGFWQLEIAGRACGALYVAGPTRTALIGVTRQQTGARWCGANHFQYAGSIGPWPLDPSLRNAFQRLGNCLRSGLGLRGIFGVDAILTDDGQVWTVEINPRYTASVEVLEAALDLPVLAWHASACRGEDPPESAPLSRTWAGKAIIYARRNFVLTAEIAAAMADAVWPWQLPDGHDRGRLLSGLADLPAEGEQLLAGKPICTVLARGPSSAAVEQALRRQVRIWEGQFYSAPDRS